MNVEFNVIADVLCVKIDNRDCSPETQYAFYLMKDETVKETNNCNLKCHNCGTPTTNYKKGFIDDGTVLATLAWTRKGRYLNR